MWQRLSAPVDWVGYRIGHGSRAMLAYATGQQDRLTVLRIASSVSVAAWVGFCLLVQPPDTVVGALGEINRTLAGDIRRGVARRTRQRTPAFNPAVVTS